MDIYSSITIRYRETLTNMKYFGKVSFDGKGDSQNPHIDLDVHY